MCWFDTWEFLPITKKAVHLCFFIISSKDRKGGILETSVCLIIYHYIIKTRHEVLLCIIFPITKKKKKGNKGWILLASCKHLCWSLEHSSFKSCRNWSKLGVTQPGQVLAEELPLTTPNITKIVKAILCSHSPQCELLNGLSAAVNSSYNKAISL